MLKAAAVFYIYGLVSFRSIFFSSNFGVRNKATPPPQGKGKKVKWEMVVPLV
jgi:hypothetical protein